jgi:hypothetical protein
MSKTGKKSKRLGEFHLYNGWHMDSTKYEKIESEDSEDTLADN